MPTRKEISGKIRRDIAEHGVPPADPMYEFALLATEDMNGVADLDDELACIADRITCLEQTPTWVKRRMPDEFDVFLDSRLAECETALTLIRHRWKQHRGADRIAPTIPR